MWNIIGTFSAFILSISEDIVAELASVSELQPENAASLHVCDKLGMCSNGRVTIQGTEYEMRCHKEVL